MNSVTIMVPTLATVLQISGGLIFLLIARKGVRKVRKWRQIVREGVREGVREADKAEDRRQAEKLAREERERLAAEKKLAERKDMFLYPWDTAYEVCDKTRTWEGAQLWLKKWMGEQQNLPQISVVAAEELLSKVVESKDKEGYSVFSALIAPHLDTGYAPHRDVSEYNLEAKLPGEWFKFWQEIKDYPARRSLFSDKRAKYDNHVVHPPHPVFRVPLTLDQAALLSRALSGNCEIKTELHASDLIECTNRKEMATVVTQ